MILFFFVFPFSLGADCGQNWYQFESKCYEHFFEPNEKLTKIETAAVCSSFPGRQLAMISTPGLRDFLKDKVDNFRLIIRHLLGDSESKDVWMTSYGAIPGIQKDKLIDLNIPVDCLLFISDSTNTFPEPVVGCFYQIFCDDPRFPFNRYIYEKNLP